jgi:hypothetical protein
MEQTQNKNLIITQISHIILIFGLVFSSLINLTLGWGDRNLWVTILTGAIGLIIPTPELMFKKIESQKSI